MFTRIQTKNTTESCLRLKTEIETADAILIGAGAGLSTSAGMVYDGERFKQYFSDFEAKYGFHDMYSGGFYPYPTPEEHWAYWSRYIMVNRYQAALKPAYDMLFQLINDKNYFVITTNVDHCFQKAGFNKERLFYTQGDYGLFQCSAPCCQSTYENESIIRRMVSEQSAMRVPTELLPKCPVCGNPMTMNLRSDDRFVEDDGWHKADSRYEEFLRGCKGLHILNLELGVGMNTPGIIKYPFWQMTFQNPNAIFACVNLNDTRVPEQIADLSICIQADIGPTLKKLGEM